MTARRRTARRDPAALERWDIVLLDKYQRGIDRFPFHGTKAQARKRVVHALRDAIETDSLVYGAVARKAGS